MTRKSNDPTMSNVYTLGFAMSLTLLGIKVAMNFIVPIFGTTGSMCMALIMLSSAFSCFIIPPILKWFKNERQCLAWLCIEYGLYMFAYVYFIPSVGYVWSFLHGIVAAVLWAAEGVYLSANMNEHDKGVKSGIFWGVYMSGTILGNLAVFFILRFIGLDDSSNVEGWHGAASIMFIFLGCISLIGAVPMFLLKPSPSEGTRPPLSSTPTMVLMKRVVKMTVSHDMIWLLMPMFYLGFQYSYLGCMLTRQLHDQSSLGLLMAVYSFVETVISTSLGSLMDKFGQMFLMNVASLTQAAGMITVWYANFTQNFLYYISFILLALSDSAYQTLIPAVVGEKFTDQETANSVFRLFQNMGGCICYLLASLFVKEGENVASSSMYAAELWLNIGLATLSHLSFIVFGHIHKAPVLPKTELPVVDDKKVTAVSNEDADAVNRGCISDAEPVNLADAKRSEVDIKTVPTTTDEFVQ